MTQQTYSSSDQLATPPEAAHGVIAAWLNGTSAQNVAFLKPEHFSNDLDKAAWSAILDLEAQGIVGDHGSLNGRLKCAPLLEGLDVPAYWRSLLDCTERADVFTMREHGGKVYEYWRRREMDTRGARERARARNLTEPLPPDPDLDLALEPRSTKRSTLADLMNTEFAAAPGPWPGIIPPGLTMLGGRPKSGKSLLLLQVCAAVAAGGMLFGQRLEKRRVLYYALEDSGQRLKERITRLDIPNDASITFDREIKPLHLGGIAELEAATKEFGLIVLDTVSRAVPGKDLIKDAALYGELLGRMQMAALERDGSVVGAAHNRKPNGMDHDPIDDVLGTTQMTTAADCVLAIYRERGRSILRGRARDMEDIDLTMEFDPARVCWNMVGRTEQVRQTENENEILQALKELGRAKASAVAEQIGAQRSNTSARLQKLVSRGQVWRELVKDVAYYYLPGDAGND